ncbi:ap-2 complex subunit sigma [Alternaria burnsii]|uniref:AP-2 complex subunit sigma n=1 Tax=Alternaria burnsii TaxID=1187904 RepID=A0A8H7AVZ2_9PLEO|nr:ap-2 complex subunit sigma [Alternaria burnsii]KAF7670660.1 ap-2 complex subunit sigma [Alternaria burnsii]
METIDPALLDCPGDTPLSTHSDTSTVGSLRALVSRRRYRRVKSRSKVHSTTDKNCVGQKPMVPRHVTTELEDQGSTRLAVIVTPALSLSFFLQRAEPDSTRHTAKMVLSFILIQNRQGKTRLAKWYAPYSDEEKIKLKGEVHRLIAPRDQKHQSNFVEFRNMSKIIYRRYAGLFFCACVDTNDNELAYLEAIHFFVEVLDAFFGNVCELDLVFNFYKVYAILDEVFLAGEIEETSKQVVLTRLAHLDKLE